MTHSWFQIGSFPIGKAALAVCFLSLALLSQGEVISQAETRRAGGGKTNSGFSYEPLAAALSSYVDDQGGVDYEGLKRNPGDLSSFLDELARLDPNEFNGWSSEAKIALWINAYNAYTLKAIIDHYPIQSSWAKSLLYPKNSIRQIEGVWDDLLWKVMGGDLTLEEMEHERLRGQFDEPRIHAALVCAARSCPPLRSEPFTGDRLDEQLEDQMRRFLSRPEKFRIDSESNVVYLSMIFDWFGQDFVNRYGTNEKFQGYNETERAVLNAVSRHIPRNQAAYLERGGFRIKYLDYDWSLNEQG